MNISPLRHIVTCAGMIAVTACATPSSSGVLKMGPDTYTVSATAAAMAGGKDEAKKMVLTAAEQHCKQMNRELLVTNISVKKTSLEGSAEVTFRCLLADDPELVRPEYF